MNSKMASMLLMLAAGSFSAAFTSIPASSSTGLTKEQEIIFKAFEFLDNDWDSFKRIFADDAKLTYCWGGEDPDCVDGSVDDILLPFHASLKTFKVSSRLLTGKGNDKAFTVHWNNYIETKHGCGQVTNGVSFWELNEDGKAIRHISTSNDGFECIPQYYQSIVEGETKES